MAALVRSIARPVARSIARGQDAGGGPATDTGLRHFVLYGQSLSLGVAPTAGGAVVSSTNSAHRMLSPGVRSYIDQLAPGGNLNGAVQPSGLLPIVDLAEQISTVSADYGETLASGIAIQQPTRHIFTATGRGAYTVEQLSRYASGSAADQYHFHNTHAVMTYASDAASDAGLTYSIPAFGWKHGEADAAAGTTRAQYKTALKTLRDNLRAHAAAAAHVDASNVPLVTDQLAFRTDVYAGGSGGASTGNGAIAVAVIEAHRAGDLIVVGPTYDCTFGAINDVHLSSTGYREHGERWGIALNAIETSGTWNPCHITAASRTGTIITLTVHVPTAPLVKDTTTFASRSFANDGFDYSGANITSVTITDDGTGDNTATIEITIDADAGGVLRYAYENAAVDFRNLVGGHIRDSASETSINSGFNFWNWLCTDEWTLA